MDEDDRYLTDSDEARESVTRLIRAIENWASRESQKTDYELSAFGAAISAGIINFHQISARDCRANPNLIGAVSRVQKHLERQHKQFDSEIDKMHVKFAHDMEELDMKIIRDRKEFKKYLSALLFAEEFNKLKRDVGAIFETLEAKLTYQEEAPPPG